MIKLKKIISLSFAILICAGLAACAEKAVQTEVVAVTKTIEDIPEEIVEAPDLPSDDGVPLSVAERKAMNSTGDLDAGLSAEENRQVELHFKFFVHKHRKTFERFLNRAEPYLPYVQSVLRERGLPEEIAYLAMVESGFNPNAVSPVGATGMWQFMPFTGKKYGLTQDNWLDERRDPFKATGAASDYLTKLYGDFGDWLFAIAAYNAGEGKIGKAIECTGANDFFELCRLNNTIPLERQRLKDETQQYVPRFLAVCKIMRNLEELGFNKLDPSAAYDVVAVDIPAGTDLYSLAKKSGWSWDEFRALNPGFKRNVSPPYASSHAYVPEGRREELVTWLASPEARVYAGWKEYKVRKSDSLAGIAKRHNVHVSLLRSANSLSSDKLTVGRSIMVPGSAYVVADSSTSGRKGDKKNSSVTQVGVASSSSKLPISSNTGKTSVSASAVSVSRQPSDNSAKPAPKVMPTARVYPVKTTHVVTVKETVFSISNKYGITQSELRTANGLSIGLTKLTVGQKLIIPANGQQQTAASAKSEKVEQKSKKSIVVKSGDTLYSLAQNNRVSLDVFCKINGLNKNSTLSVGQTLRFP